MPDPNEESTRGMSNVSAGLSAEQLANISKILGTMSGVSSEFDKANKGVDDFTKKFGILIGEMDRVSDKFLKAMGGVSKKVDEDSERFKSTVKGIATEVGKVSNEFTKFGKAAIEHMGIAGTAVNKFFDLLKEVPLIGKVAGVLSVFAMIALGHRMFEEEEKARALRVGMSFAQYTGQLEVVKDKSLGLLRDLRKDFGMSWDAVEKFLSSLGTLGKVELGKTGDRFANLAIEIKKLSVATGLSTDTVVGDMGKMYRATGMFGTEIDKVGKSLQDVYTWAIASGLGISNYTNMIGKAVDQMRLLGTEQRALTGMAELYGGVKGAFGEFRERVGMGGITEMFGKITDIVGRVMTETPLFMRTMGLTKVGEVAGKWEEVQAGKVSPVEIFQRWMEKMIMPIQEGRRAEALGIQFGGTPAAFALGKEMMQKYDELIKLTERIKEGDVSARKDYLVAQKELEAHMKEAKKLAMDSLPPLQRIEIVLDEFMRKGLGELTKVITGMLGMIINFLSTIAIGIGVLIPSSEVTTEHFKMAWEATKASTNKMVDGLEKSVGLLKQLPKDLAEKGLNISGFGDIETGLGLGYWKNITLGKVGELGAAPKEGFTERSKEIFGTAMDYWLKKLSPREAGAAEIPAGRMPSAPAMGGVGATEPVIVPRGKVRVDKTSRFGDLEFKITMTAADIFKVMSPGI